MARLNRKHKRRKEEQEGLMALQAFMNAVIGVFRMYLFITSMIRPRRPELSPNPDFYQTHINNINRLVRGNDTDCHEQLRVNRQTFFRLCCLVRGVGLTDSRNVCLEERVAIFVWVLSHHTKQRRTKFKFYRSTEIVSRHFNAVLQAVLRLHRMLLEMPIPVPADDQDNRWNWFQAHPQKVKNLYGKSFPYFDDWCVLFGKDRATGVAAEDYDEMARPDIPDEFSEPHNSNDFYDAMFENYDQHLPNTPTTLVTPTTPVTPTPHPSLPTSTPCGSTPAANAGVPNKRKRTRMGDAELSIHASMDNFFKSSCSYMDKMSNSFGYDKELSARRTMVKDELSKLDITLTEKFKLSAIIVCNVCVCVCGAGVQVDFKAGFCWCSHEYPCVCTMCAVGAAIIGISDLNINFLSSAAGLDCSYEVFMNSAEFSCLVDIVSAVSIMFCSTSEVFLCHGSAMSTLVFYILSVLLSSGYAVLEGV
ncbi:hypothetical protein RHMOL_Rhmol05G0191000 [Rhododendron molle]|uniref:Uncharacterized protein n=1 Tax=Rhododendron molle TaxID=49168 RepID=A0ACC0NSC4_RHOML|nr:hypothetical protein RHMOL_Rhmol05G0191000 [Rhododendron molle]